MSKQTTEAQNGPAPDDVQIKIFGLPRVEVESKVAGPQVLADLDRFSAAGQRPVLVLLYEDLRALPVLTTAAGLSCAGFAPALGVA